MAILSLILVLLAVGLAVGATFAPDPSPVALRLLAASVGCFELAELLDRLGRT